MGWLYFFLHTTIPFLPCLSIADITILQLGSLVTVKSNFGRPYFTEKENNWKHVAYKSVMAS
jgi:hypothetical protein